MIRYILAIALTLTLAACASDTTTQNATGNLRLEAALTSTTVSGTAQSGHGAQIQTTYVDSMRIGGAKFMISEIKLQRKDSAGDVKVATGPAVLSVTTSGAQLVLVGTVPAGTYNKLSLKFHRLNDEEIVPRQSDANFADFVTPNRYTIMISGNLFAGSAAAIPFIYGSKVEEDLKWDMADFNIDQTAQTVIALALDPVQVFRDKDTGLILDPRDPENQNKIDDNIKAALNALRK